MKEQNLQSFYRNRPGVFGLTAGMKAGDPACRQSRKDGEGAEFTITLPMN